MTEAFGDLDVDDLLLEGTALTSQVREAIAGAKITRPIDSAPTLVLGVIDPYGELLRSGMFSSRVTMTLGEHGFELAGVSLQESTLTLTFEDIDVAAMRRLREPRKIAAGSMTRKEFIRQLVSEVPGLKFVAPLYDSGPVKSELSRGTVVDPAKGPTQAVVKDDVNDTREDTWDATGRLADQVQWLRFMRGPREFVFTDEAALVQGEALFTVSRDNEAINAVGFEYDVGMSHAQMTIDVFAEKWAVPPGSHVHVEGYGPCDGHNLWFVGNIERDLFSMLATATLLQPRPSLPEPEGSITDDLSGLEGGEFLIPGEGDEYTVGVGKDGWYWPAGNRSKVTSKFGPRGGRMHEGIDIGLSVDTMVFPARAGTVTEVRRMSGYGMTVVVTGNKFRHLYAHLNQPAVVKGQHVEPGRDLIGLSGGEPGTVNAGNSRGPHLHFQIEAMPGGNPIDPLTLLP